ncbi:hypothetical protein [Pedobacter sp. SYSU D00535]|uniref:hypothetical protein n=1 Tax=Pedobacter sp. SYSU D00535 TaxID=2810308 RepID=UPI001A95AAEB|nr:hypothetical protein [Pedobacter sp. SYSU D00535]
MTSIICTLVEGKYHYGLAALINSLEFNGFEGEVFVGYRGEIPGWAERAASPIDKGSNELRILRIGQKIKINFLSIDTAYHFTNYKPDFLLRVIEIAQPEAIYYFDPDIVVTAPWTFYQEWVKAGIAVSEDVNSPVSKFHPKRVFWRKYFQQHGFSLTFKDQIYVNGGFLGLCSKNFPFLDDWKRIQEAMAPVIGGLSKSIFGGNNLPAEAKGDFAPFGKTDQDALNAALEAWHSQEISYLGKEGMGFTVGPTVMAHALGGPKPWSKKFIKAAFMGVPPSTAEKEFWKNASGTISPFPPGKLRRKKIGISLAALIGRFYRRN